ncbi:unannotated protein [freshwater metagenome]|uniref:Unannotated protein n=1 Tax=freshwater metagenome TaxID=449393 RepID=A0A6J6NQ54_9ZZZZ
MTTPSLLSTERANSSISAELLIAPKPSRNHCTAAPVTNTPPSLANALVLSGACHATVAKVPLTVDGISLPLFTKRNEPVP